MKDKKNKKYEWNLNPLYKSLDDNNIRTSIENIVKAYEDFALKYDNKDKQYLIDDNKLLEALNDFEKITIISDKNPLLYLYYKEVLNSSDKKVIQLKNQFSDILTKAENKILFFKLSLGSIKSEKQKEILNNDKLKKFHFLLKCIFIDSKYFLSDKEEQILSLKYNVSHGLWTSTNSKILNSLSVKYKGKILPINEALGKIQDLKKKERDDLYSKITDKLQEISVFSEAEINAVIKNKKIDDDLRGAKSPDEITIKNYRNDKQVVDNLVNIVTRGFKISNRFYKIKARIMKQKTLSYSDRHEKIGKINQKFTFEHSVKILKDVFGEFDIKYSDILDNFIKNGQIDVYPKIGKKGGAFCSSTYTNPTYVLLNHTDSFKSFGTIAHEMGHAFHSELCRNNTIFDMDYSTSIAETASTFFENLAINHIINQLPKKDRITALHDKISNDISTIFRQIACYNYEKDLHKEIKEKGYLSKEQIVDLHNKNMSDYLGPVFKFEQKDGYSFVNWSHLRYFFYVYTYAYGGLLSKYLLSQYYKDKTFKEKIEKILSAGGNDTPENILKSVGIDIIKDNIFEKGLESIENDINEFERLVNETNKKKIKK